MGSVDRNMTSLHTNLVSKDVPGSEQNGSQSVIPGNIMTSGKIECSHISPQMAPPWLEKSGTSKSGQMVSQGSDAARTIEQTFNVGKVLGSLEAHDSKELANAAADTNQGGVIFKTLVTPICGG